jgi:DNA-binding transcriptional ArsR family regulator
MNASMTVAVDPELNLFHSDPTLLQRAGEAEYERTAAAFREVACPERLALLHALIVGEDTPQRAALWAGLPQSVAERELRALARAGVALRYDSPRGPVYAPDDGHLVVLLHVALAHGRERDAGLRRQPRFLSRRRARAVG